MRPFLIVASLALAAFAQSATAGTIEITGLPGSVQANGTATVVEFQVTVTLDTRECAGGTQQPFTVEVSARLDNATGSVNASVSPTSMSIDVGPSDTVQDGESYTEAFTLIVQSSDLVAPLDAVAIVTATPSTVQCLVPITSASLDEATGNVTVIFEPMGQPNNDPGPQEEPVPGPALPLLALALVGAAVLLRRRK